MRANGATLPGPHTVNRGLLPGWHDENSPRRCEYLPLLPSALAAQPQRRHSTAANNGRLRGSWRLLLLGDDSPTQHLVSLNGRPQETETIAMAADTGTSGTKLRRKSYRKPPYYIRRQNAAIIASTMGKRVHSSWKYAEISYAE